MIGDRLRDRVRRRSTWPIPALLAAGLLGILSAPVIAASPTFGSPSATSAYGQGIAFVQPVALTSPVDRVELVLDFPGSSGSFVVEVQPPSGTGPATLRYTWSIATQGHLDPNTRIAAHWRLRPAGAGDGSEVDGPTTNVTYVDDRFHWQTQQAGIVRVHWYQGDPSFGSSALRIAQGAIAQDAALLGVTETQPIDFFIYADQAAFRDALGPATGEFVVGQAIPELRTLFGLITPADIGGPEVARVVVHELTHVVFDTATRNPYHQPPKWLNEGLAVYVSQGYDSSDRALVGSAVRDGMLYPLAALAGDFPTGEKVFLGYAEGVAAVDYVVRRFGRPALSTLVDSYSRGLTDDAAFTAALGLGADAFDAAWFRDLGASPPARVGPQPDPAGPLPSGWTGAVASPGPAASGAGASGAAQESPAPLPGVGEDVLATIAPLGGLAALIAGLVALLALRRRRRSVTGMMASIGPAPDGTPEAPEGSEDPEP